MRTKQDYEAYQAEVRDFLEANQVKPGYYSSKNAESDGFFSWAIAKAEGRQ